MTDDQTYADVLNFMIPNVGIVESLDAARKLYAAALEQSCNEAEAGK